MKFATAIFIDLRNAKHVHWWNTIGRRFVKIVGSEDVIEVATNKSIGKVFALAGPLAKIIERYSVNTFLKGATKKIFLNFNLP